MNLSLGIQDIKHNCLTLFARTSWAKDTALTDRTSNFHDFSISCIVDFQDNIATLKWLSDCSKFLICAHFSKEYFHLRSTQAEHGTFTRLFALENRLSYFHWVRWEVANWNFHRSHWSSKELPFEASRLLNCSEEICSILISFTFLIFGKIRSIIFVSHFTTSHSFH